MNKKFHSALSALIVMGAGCCALAFASPPSRGSTVLVPPLIADGAVKHKRIAGTLRLPSQAGKVSKMVRTNLVSKGPSWIAKGDKYYSLCTPNRRMVACAPIVATSVMQDIEVDARKGPNGEPLLTFTVATGTRQAPKRLTHAIAYFLARTNKQVAHFNRMAVAYSPSSGSVSPRGGLTKSAIVAGNGGGCSYDDDDSYDCSGGDSGSGGSYEGDGSEGGGEDPVPGPSTPPYRPGGECEGNCSYPPGDNNGDPDPCIDANGNAICPVVIVPGERPNDEEQLSLPGCRPAGPFTVVCGSPPPVVGGEPQELPRGPTPWFPQAMCNISSIFCSAGQVPDTPPPLNDEERRKQEYQKCYAKANAHATSCRDMRVAAGDAWYRQCMSDAIQESKECDLLYNQPAP